jgi:hypothetical protein
VKILYASMLQTVALLLCTAAVALLFLHVLQHARVLTYVLTFTTVYHILCIIKTTIRIYTTTITTATTTGGMPDMSALAGMMGGAGGGSGGGNASRATPSATAADDDVCSIFISYHITCYTSSTIIIAI